MAPSKRPTRGEKSDPDQPRLINDPAALNALAHPLRLGIIELLAINGAMTATELADVLDESPANCSWHLRKLADYDFVTEAEGATGRKRPWRLTRVGFRVGGPDATPEERRAGRGFSRVWTQRLLERYLAAEERVDAEGGEWRDAADLSETAVWLTAQELKAVNEQFQEILSQHKDRVVNESKRPEGSRLVELVTWGMPVDDLFTGGKK